MPELLKPPAIPSAILNFFAAQPDFPAVAGDIAEEFQLRAQTLGPGAAKRWYWRESFRNALALTAREIYRTPGRTIVLALGCVIAVNVLTALWLFLSYYPRSIDMFLNRFQYFDPMEFVLDQRRRDLALLVQFVGPLATGWIGGRLLRGREWALTLMFTLVSAGVALPPACYLFLSLKVALPAPIAEFMAAGFAFRLSGFWLGALWVRKSRAHMVGIAIP